MTKDRAAAAEREASENDTKVGAQGPRHPFDQQGDVQPNRSKTVAKRGKAIRPPSDS
jgi:hypothetical protein